MERIEVFSFFLFLLLSSSSYILIFNCPFFFCESACFIQLGGVYIEEEDYDFFLHGDGV